jgi:two-component system sensor histidine kinase KdpD
VQILTHESERLNRLVQAILDVSRLEAGRLRLNLGPVAVEPLLARACASILPGTPPHTWTLSVPEALPPAWADEILLEEILRNLLENAVHYSPAGTAIEVSAAVVDGAVSIAVTDHGPGVPADERDLIFQSFHRVGADESTIRGYGLGLYFADRLVRAQDGSIVLETPVWPDPAAPGSRFSFTIPIASDDPGDPDALPPQSATGDASWP